MVVQVTEEGPEAVRVRPPGVPARRGPPNTLCSVRCGASSHFHPHPGELPAKLPIAGINTSNGVGIPDPSLCLARGWAPRVGRSTPRRSRRFPTAAPAPGWLARPRPGWSAVPMDPTASRCFLIRHGETEWSLSRRHTGRTDLPLLPVGRKQAEALRLPLSRWSFRLVLHSPLARAVETCSLAGLGPGAVADPDLAEWDYGTY